MEAFLKLIFIAAVLFLEWKLIQSWKWFPMISVYFLKPEERMRHRWKMSLWAHIVAGLISWILWMFFWV